LGGAQQTLRGVHTEKKEKKTKTKKRERSIEEKGGQLLRGGPKLGSGKRTIEKKTSMIKRHLR